MNVPLWQVWPLKTVSQPFHLIHFLHVVHSVTSIGNSVFTNCNSLRHITLGTGLTSIGDSAFGNLSTFVVIFTGPYHSGGYGTGIFPPNESIKLHFKQNPTGWTSRTIDGYTVTNLTSDGVGSAIDSIRSPGSTAVADYVTATYVIFWGRNSTFSS